MAMSQVLLLLNQNIENEIIEKSNPKFKVTSFDVCGSYIVLGSNSGTLYFLSCNNLTVLHKLPTQNGRTVRISISPDEAYLGYASSSGLVYVTKVPGQIPCSTLHPVSSKEHEGSTVTALAWSQSGEDLYIGDNAGYLSLLHVPSSLASSLILNLTHYLMKLDSSIFQLDVQYQYLLVSTLTKSYICDTQLETYTQIGTKSRQGEYGGCFCNVTANRKLTADLNESLELSQQVELSHGNSQSVEIEHGTEALIEQFLPSKSSNGECDHLISTPDIKSVSTHNQTPIAEDKFGERDVHEYFQRQERRLFCSRPGSRLWESDFRGKVLATHQLKKVTSITPTPTILLNNSSVKVPCSEDMTDSYKNSNYSSANSVSFKKVVRFYDEYLLTNSINGIYVIDPNSSKVLLWTPITEGIKDIRVYGNAFIILTLDGKLHKLQVATIDIAILTLHANGLHEQCANMCLKYASIFRTSPLLKQFWKDIMKDLLFHVENKTLVQGIDELKRNIALYPFKEQSDFDNRMEKNKLSNPSTDLKSVDYVNDQPLLNEKEDGERFIPEKDSESPEKTGSNSCISAIFSYELRANESGGTSFEDRSNYQPTNVFFNELKVKTTNSFSQINNEETSTVQDIVGNLASNLVGAITSSTKSLKDSISSSSPLQKTGQFILRSLDGSVISGEQYTALETALESQPSDGKKLDDNTDSVIIQTYPRKEKSKQSHLKNIFSKKSNNETKAAVVTPLPSYLIDFRKTVSDVTEILLLSDSETSVIVVLTQWLKEYSQITEKIRDSKMREKRHEDENENMSTNEENVHFYPPVDCSDLVKDVSSIFLICFQQKIIISDHKNYLNYDEAFTVHPLLPEDIVSLDTFYSILIYNDENLIDYSFIMNNFHSLERHLLFHSWISLMKKITSTPGDSHSPQILPDIEFTRSQRIQYLRGLAEFGNWETFLIAASTLASPSVLFDVYYFSYHNSQLKETKPPLDIELYDCLTFYLSEVSLRENIGEVYVKYWSKCPELQFEIFASLLHSWNKVESSCNCGFPFPNAFISGSSTSFLKAITSLPIYQPEEVLKLFESKCFYTGMFNLVFRYKLRSFEDIVPYITQSLHKPSIISMFDHIHPRWYSQVLRIVSRMIGSIDTTVTCLNCSSLLSVRPSMTPSAKIKVELYPVISSYEELQFDDKEPQTRQNGEVQTHLQSYSSLWQLVYINILKRIGSLKTLLLLHDMIDVLPHVTFLKKLFVQSIMCSLAEQKGSYFRWTMAQSFFFTPRLYISSEVRSAFDYFVTWRNDEREREDEVFIQRFSLSSIAGVDSERELDFSQNKIATETESESSSFLDVSNAESKNESSSLPEEESRLGTSSSTNHLRPVVSQFATNQEVPRASNHWGVRVQLLNGVCHLCQLGLTVEVMVNAGGLTVFSCGHAYHTVCLMQYGRFCILCHRPNYLRQIV